MLDIGLQNIDVAYASMIFDGLLIALMAGMWFLWHQQNGHRKRIESKLFEAAAQLQESTQLLEHALEKIEAISQRDNINKHVDVEGDGIHVQLSDAGRKRAQSQANQRVKNIPQRAVSARAAAKPEARVQGGQPKQSQVTQILRMKREGASADKIASTLDIPQAQVKLMLMLQQAQ